MNVTADVVGVIAAVFVAVPYSALGSASGPFASPCRINHSLRLLLLLRVSHFNLSSSRPKEGGEKKNPNFAALSSHHLSHSSSRRCRRRHITYTLYHHKASYYCNALKYGPEKSDDVPFSTTDLLKFARSNSSTSSWLRELGPYSPRRH